MDDYYSVKVKIIFPLPCKQLYTFWPGEEEGGSLRWVKRKGEGVIYDYIDTDLIRRY